MKLHTRPGLHRVDTSAPITLDGPYRPRRVLRLRIAIWAVVALLRLTPTLATLLAMWLWR